MKKILFMAVVALLAANVVSAQDVFQKGDLVFNAGIGLNSSLYCGSGYKSTIPPISLSGEYGVADNLIGGNNGSIGVGGYLGHTAADYKINDFGWKYSSIIVGARGAFHYQFAKNLDTYAGTMLGYNIVSAKSIGTENAALGKASASEFSFSLFVGARYWFTPGFGVFGEFGYGISNANLGVSFRL
jgi:opacity protein-like surface antigen